MVEAHLVMFLTIIITATAGQHQESVAVGTLTLTDDDENDGMYREEPTSSTPEPMYPDGVNTIPGDADIHYPVYEKIFKTSFSCSGRLAGFYADVEARCQIWHICDVDGRMQSFLCTNGTIFSQETRVCEWWYNTNCDANFVKRNYEHNKELYQTFKETDLVPEKERIQVEERHRSGQNAEQQILRQAPTLGTRVITQEAPTRPQPPPPTRLQVTTIFRPVQQEFPTVPTRVTAQNERGSQRYEVKVQEFQDRDGSSQNQRQNKEIQAQNAQQIQLSREELEQRRQAARNEFYSVQAKIEQAKRITQQHLQEQQRNQLHLQEQQRPDPREQQHGQQRPDPREQQHGQQRPDPREQQHGQQRPYPREQQHGQQRPDPREQRNQQRPQEQHRPDPREQRPHEQQRSRPQDQLRNQQQRPTATSLPITFTTFPPLFENIAVPTSSSNSPGLSPKQKFRHSTPRKHNVSFRPSLNVNDNESEERQIPAETKQKPFPGFYANSQIFKSRKGEAEEPEISEELTGRKAPPLTEVYINPYLPTSNEPIDVRPTVPEVQPLPQVTATTPTPKLRKRKRRPRPIKKQNVDILRQVSPPRPIQSYRPPPPEPPAISPTIPQIPRNEEKDLFRAKPARIVVKRKFRNQNKKESQENANDFPGNPHLEQKVENEFRHAHAAQKRCAVVGVGNTFKVLC